MKYPKNNVKGERGGMQTHYQGLFDRQVAQQIPAEVSVQGAHNTEAQRVIFQALNKS